MFPVTIKYREMIRMKVMVLFSAYESIVGVREVAHLRKCVGECVRRVSASGKMESGGVFADRRGGYMILNVKEPDEFLDLFRGDLLDNMKIEIHPIYTFEALGAFFDKHPLT